MVNRNAPLAVRGTRLAIRKGLGLPLYEAELLAEAYRERVRAHRGRQGRPARVHGEARARSGEPSDVERRLIRDDPLRGRRRRPRRHHHARTGPRCSTPSTGRCARRSATPGTWSRPTPTVHAVVLRAAGDRAFCAGLDTSKSLRPARRRVEPRRPRRAPQPEVAEGVEAGGVRGARDVHRRRVLLRQRGRHRHLLRRRDLLRLARHLRLRVGARADRAHAPDRARRHAAHGADRATTSGSRADDRAAASGWSPRSCRATSSGTARTRSRPASRRKPTAATQGTVRAIWESLDRPYRAAMEQGLHVHPARQPDRAWPRSQSTGVDRTPSRGSDDGRRDGPHRRAASREVLALDPSAPALEFERRVVDLGRARRHGRRGRRRTSAARASAVGRACCATARRGRAAARAAARRRVRGHGQPGARRRAAARRPRRRSASPLARRRARRPRGARRRRAAGDRSRRRSASSVRRSPRDRPVDRADATAVPASRCEMLTSGTTGPPKRDRPHATRRSSACCVGAKHYETQPRTTTCGCASGVVDRQLAAGAPRRPLPRRCSASTTAGRSALLERFTRRRVDRRGAPAPAQDREPRARRAAHGARRRRRPRRLRQRPLGGVGHRAARSRRRRRVHRAVRRAGARCRTRATEFGGGVAGLEPRRPRAVLGGQAGQRRPGARRAASCASSIPTTGATARHRRGGPARGARPAQLGDDAGWMRTTDLARHRRRRLPLDPRPRRPGDHPRRVQGAARGRARRARARPAGARARPWSASADARLGAVPVAAVELRPGADASPADDLLDGRGERAGPLRAAGSSARRRRRCRARASGKVDLAAVRELFAGGRTDGPRPTAAEDEAFRAELRAWLEAEVPAHGPPPPPGDWPARRAYDTGWQRKLLRRRLRGHATGRRSSAAAGLPVTQQLVFLEEYAARRRAVRRRELRRPAARRPDADRRGHRRAAGVPPAADPARARACGARASPSRGAGSDLASLRTPGGARRRRLRRQRPEDLEHPRPRRRLLRAARAHRSRRAEAQGHHLADPRHGPARHRGAADADHRRREPVLRGVPRRRARAGRRTGSATRTTAGGSPTSRCASSAAPRSRSTSSRCARSSGAWSRSRSTLRGRRRGVGRPGAARAGRPARRRASRRCGA